MDDGAVVKRQHQRLQFSPANSLLLDDSPRSSQSEQKHVDQIVARATSTLHSSPAKLSGMGSSPTVATEGKAGGSTTLSRPNSSPLTDHPHHKYSAGVSSRSQHQKQSPSREVATLARIIQTQQEMQTALQDLVSRVTQVHKAVLTQVGEIESQGQGEGSRLQHQRASGDDASVGVFRPARSTTEGLGLSREWLLISVVLVFQTFLQWFFSR